MSKKKSHKKETKQRAYNKFNNSINKFGYRTNQLNNNTDKKTKVNSPQEISYSRCQMNKLSILILILVILNAVSLFIDTCLVYRIIVFVVALITFIITFKQWKNNKNGN